MKGSSKPTVGKIAESIASSIGLTWPNDKEKIFKNLHYVSNFIWKSGLFEGSTAWFRVNVRPDGTIITPPGWNILLGINVDEKPTMIRDKYFLFHQNGPGVVGAGINPCCNGENYTDDVYDLGESATLLGIDDCCSNPCFNIGVKSSVCEEHKTTLVSGLNCCGKQIYTYKKIENKQEVLCECSSDEIPEDIEVVSGVEFKISNNLRIASSVHFSEITDITKPPTRGVVSYYMLSDMGQPMKLLAEIDPNDTSSAYKIYKLPQQVCRYKCIIGLFKKSKPAMFFSESQRFIIDDMPTIESLAIAIDYEFEKKNPAESRPYYTSALGHLNASVAANKSNSTTTIQIKSHESLVKGIRRW